MVSTASAAAATPQPNDAANAIAAKPSSAAFSRSWSGPRPMPSLIEPRMVSGTGAEDDGRGHEALDEAGPAARPVLRREPALEPAAEPLEPVLEPEQRAHDPPDQQCPEHDQERSAVADGLAQASFPIAAADGRRDQQGDQSEPVGDHRAGAVGQPMTDEHTDGGADQHGDDVDQGAESDEQRGAAQVRFCSRT
jgi:hypothetical protein